MGLTMWLIRNVVKQFPHRGGSSHLQMKLHSKNNPWLTSSTLVWCLHNKYLTFPDSKRRFLPFMNTVASQRRYPKCRILTYLKQCHPFSPHFKILEIIWICLGLSPSWAPFLASQFCVKLTKCMSSFTETEILVLWYWFSFIFSR